MHVLGLRDNEWLKTRFLSVLLANQTKQQAFEAGQQFALELVPQVRAAAVAEIKRHRRLGHYTVLATASPDFYVEAVNAYFDLDEVVCTRSSWAADTGFQGLDGGNCYGEQKFRRVKDALARLGNAALTAMYSDHRSDETLLAAAETAYLVNPDGKTARTISVDGILVVDWDGNA